tara:strand:+ start:11024 stop:11614 length:591 start_codon:yes stop_codon:yes gene_type:complete
MNALAPSHKNTDDRDDLICIGAIFGAAGVRGAVRLKVFTEDLKSISKYGPVTIVGREFPQGKKFELEILHNVKGGVAAKLKNVNGRDQADALKGSELYIERAALPEIEEEGDFYFEDMIGLLAKDKQGDLFGEVDGVFNFGAGDIIEVNLSTEKGKRMYPFTDEVVPEVNIEAGYVIVDRDAFEDGANVTETDQEG